MGVILFILLSHIFTLKVDQNALRLMLVRNRTPQSLDPDLGRSRSETRLAL